MSNATIGTIAPIVQIAPTLWAAQCTYCATQRSLFANDHESELMDKARKLCKLNDSTHFTDFVYSGLDFADHAKLNPVGQIQYLTQLHTQIGCHCQDSLASQITENTRISHSTHPTQNEHSTLTTHPTQTSQNEIPTQTSQNVHSTENGHKNPDQAFSTPLIPILQNQLNVPNSTPSRHIKINSYTPADLAKFTQRHKKY